MQSLEILVHSSFQLHGTFAGIDKNVLFLAFISSFFATAIRKNSTFFGAVWQICFTTIVTAALTPVVKTILEIYISQKMDDDISSLTDAFSVAIPVVIAGFFEYIPKLVKLLYTWAIKKVDK